MPYDDMPFVDPRREERIDIQALTHFKLKLPSGHWLEMEPGDLGWIYPEDLEVLFTLQCITQDIDEDKVPLPF